GELLLEAQRIECELKLLSEGSQAFFDAYTSGAAPWLLLDTAQRDMDQLDQNLFLKDKDALLERLVLKARARYMEAGSALSECFLRLYKKDGFIVHGALRQAEIFDKKVRQSLDEGKTVYLWIDALRLEMGHRLAHILSDDFDVKITPALATAPTVTEIGMASLLPGAKDGRVVSIGDGRLALSIGGTTIKSRPDRMKYLEGFAKDSGFRFFACNLDELLPRPKNPISEAISEADLIVVTSQEIDERCESDNISSARSSMSDLLNRLQGALRILSNLGIDRFVLTADHGYIFGEELGEDMKIDPPGGETLDLTRRVWVGRGGAADSSYLRLKLSDLGQATDLEMAVPWRFACFKVKGGARAYFHGGLSPQELIIPVLTMTALRKEQENDCEIVWSLAHASKVTTRIFLVTISGRAKKFQALTAPTIRLELRDESACVSEIDDASYGFIKDTKEVKLTTLGGDPYGLAPNVVTLKITKKLSGNKLKLHLIDARTGVELTPEKQLDVFILEY
ncbi:MAG: PglZ domain-containing protein, partial [Methanothrix sp.]